MRAKKNPLDVVEVSNRLAEDVRNAAFSPPRYLDPGISASGGRDAELYRQGALDAIGLFVRRIIGAEHHPPD